MEGPLVSDPGGVGERGGGVWEEEGWCRLPPWEAGWASCLPVVAVPWLCPGEPALRHWKVGITSSVSLQTDEPSTGFPRFRLAESGVSLGDPLLAAATNELQASLALPPPPPQRKRGEQQLWSARCAFHSICVSDCGCGLKTADAEPFAGGGCPGCPALLPQVSQDLPVCALRPTAVAI